MHSIGIVAGSALVFLILWDTFETIIVPRTLVRALPVRLTRLFYSNVWPLWKATVNAVLPSKWCEVYLGAFGPLSLLLLIGLWATGLVLGFSLIDWGIRAAATTPNTPLAYGSYLYMSGTIFFTLGLVDILPKTGLGRFAVVTEGGIGFIFLAVVISYLPVLYQTFARREKTITALYARAGTPPSATAILCRYAGRQHMGALTSLLEQWEDWATELLETYLSYPMLALYRSHHPDESWLSTLTVILDTCALLLLPYEGQPDWARAVGFQADITFEVASHVIADLAKLLHLALPSAPVNRLSPDDWQRVHTLLGEHGITLRPSPDVEATLVHLRRQYEPYAAALSRNLVMALPQWVVDADERRSPAAVVIDNDAASAHLS